MFRRCPDQYCFDCPKPRFGVALLQGFQHGRREVAQGVCGPRVDPSSPDLIDCLAQKFRHIPHRAEGARGAVFRGSWGSAGVGLMDRGILRPGMMADIAIFDPATSQDVATYQDPLRYSVGVEDVFVNGRPVVLDGKITEERPGRALRGPGYKPVH